MTPQPDDDSPGPGSRDDPAVFDLDGALNRVDGDRGILRMIVLCYLDDAPRQLLRLRSSYANRDWPETGRIAHSLRGASSSVGAAGAARAASRLEIAAGDKSASEVARFLAELDDAFTLFRRTVTRTEFAARTTAPVKENWA